MAIHCDNKALSYHLYFEDVRGRHYPVTKVWSKQSDIVEEELPCLMENARIGIHFYAEEDEPIFTDNVYVRLETSIYKDIEEQELFEVPLRNQRGAIRWLYEGKDDEEFPWRMGIYFFELHINGGVYLGGFKVIPIHLNDEQTRHIHTFLNDQVNGIIYDFVCHATAIIEDTDVGLPDHWYYIYARQVSSFYNSFMHVMTKMVKQPKQTIETMYHSSKKAGKIDHKSIRWANSNKGFQKNAGATSLYTLHKTKKEQINTKENGWVKHILFLWGGDIREVQEKIVKDKDTLLQKYRNLNQELTSYQQERDRLSQKRNVGENMLRDLRSRILMTKKEMDKTNTQVHVLQKWVDGLHTFEKKIVYFLHHTFLIEVDRAYHKPTLKDNRYHRLDDMYNQTKNLDKIKGNKHRLTPVLKPTWQIYEYFCLFKVLEQLRKLGYSILKGIADNVKNYYFEDRIPEGVAFVLGRDNRVVHIRYDHYHPNSAESAEAKGEMFYSLRPKKKPDIKVDFFEKREHVLWLKGSMVFDSKFSKFNSIYSSGYHNSTTEQLGDYYSFFYQGAGDRSGNVVDDVICLYAGNDQRETLIVKHPITYVRLFPSFSGDGSVEGEEELFQLLERIESR